MYMKWSFPLSVSSVNVTNSQESSGLLTFNQKILDGKLHFLCIGITIKKPAVKLLAS